MIGRRPDRYLFPWLRHVFADGAYAGQKLETALRGHGQWTLEIVKRSDQTKGFQVLQYMLMNISRNYHDS